MEIKKVNILNKLQIINDYWNPRIVGELNGQSVKLVKFKGEFVRHKHHNEDELFFVIKGKLQIELDEQTLEICENEFVIIPKGTPHKPIAIEEVSVLLLEPISTINTGDTTNNLTKVQLEHI